MAQSVKSEDVNNTFFDGYYKNIWRQVFPEKTTLAEVDFIITEADLQKGDRILDIMCGFGRHSLELARRGVKVTAVDNLSDYVEEIREQNTSENLDIEALCENVLEMQLHHQYNVAICMGNSLQFFNEKDTLRLLSNLSSHLHSGGTFIINIWSIAEIVIKQFVEKGWGRFNDLLFFSDNKYLLKPSRIETTSIIITDKGDREEKVSIDYIFSINEIESMLNKTGFRLKEIYSIPGKKLFTIGDPRAYFVAEKK